MRMKRFFSLVLVLAMTAIALSGCSGDKAEASSDDSITIGIPQDLEDGLDPHIVAAAGTKEILYNIYEGLVKYDSQGNLQDAIAESHEVSADGLTYTFVLRDGVKFHDGNLVTADDVIYSINRCADATGGEPLVPAFSNISDIKSDDGKTVVITLNTPDSDFLAYMTTAIIPMSNPDPASIVIGTGPYKFMSRIPQDSIELEKFDDYYGKPANIRYITLKVCANADSVVMNLKGGSIDMMCRITAAQAAELEGSDIKVLEGTMNLVQALYINNAAEPFDDVRVRRALCYAVDPQEIMMFVSDGKGEEIGSCMFPAFGKYFEEDLNNMYDTDTEKARQLLTEAGYPDGFEFTITVPSNYAQHVDTAQVLAEQFKEIGVTANIELVEWDTWLSDVYAGRNYETTVIGTEASVLTARALIERYQTDSDKNFINFSSPEFDETLANALACTDEEMQTEYYKQCLNILASEASNVYIQDLPTFTALNNKYDGYVFYPLYVQDFSSLYIVHE